MTKRRIADRHSRWESGLVSRREALVRGAAALFAATGAATPGVIFAQNQIASPSGSTQSGLAASAASAASATAAAVALPTGTRSPGLVEGPYWVNGDPNTYDLRYDWNSGAIKSGFYMTLQVNVTYLYQGVLYPVNGARVDLWHADAAGVYSAVSAQNTVGQLFLRGYLLTNAKGNANFITIYPGWYRGRTPHIHVRTYTGAAVRYVYTSQLFFSETVTDQVYATAPYNARGARDTTNATDGIYTGPSTGNGGAFASNAGQYMLLTLNKTGTAVAGYITIVL